MYIDVNTIQATPYTSKLDGAEICDCFVNQDDQLLYLMNKKDKIFWLEESFIPKDKIDTFMSIWKNSAENMLTNTMCRVNKEKDETPCLKKTRTKGMLLAVYNCGIIGSYKEIFCSESLSQVSFFLFDILDQLPKYIIYDNACHLEPFIKTHNKLDDKQSAELKKKVFVIDRLHYNNHTRKECKS